MIVRTKFFYLTFRIANSYLIKPDYYFIYKIIFNGLNHNALPYRQTAFFLVKYRFAPLEIAFWYEFSAAETQCVGITLQQKNVE